MSDLGSHWISRQTCESGSMIPLDPGSRSMGSDLGIHFWDPWTCLVPSHKNNFNLEKLNVESLRDTSTCLKREFFVISATPSGCATGVNREPTHSLPADGMRLLVRKPQHSAVSVGLGPNPHQDAPLLRERFPAREVLVHSQNP